ncbi:MAG: hypothetical protein NVS1B14_11080 [Vulcanimicrobiaceae bacterium]
MLRTSCKVITHINVKLVSACCVALCLAPAALAQTAQPALPASSAQVLSLYRAATSPAGVKQPAALESFGTLHGATLEGSFHAWHEAARERVDQNLGLRMERTLRLGERRYQQNSSGDVIALKGILLRRSVTQDFVGSDRFSAQPQYSKLLGAFTLADGRRVFRLEVSPPEGETETIDIDSTTHLIDRMEYFDGDGPFSIDFLDYRTVRGLRYSFKQIESDGDHAFDVTQVTTALIPDAKVSPAVFAPLVPALIQLTAPVTVPLEEHNGALYVRVGIFGQNFNFLLDTGAQGMALDTSVATKLHLVPQGSFEVRGTARAGGIGVAALDTVTLGGALLPVRAVSTLDLRGSTAGRFPIDGILGFPLFGAAMVQIDYGRLQMTIGRPGMLPATGARIDIDVDRELPEATATVNGIPGRFMIDTGNGNELLLFHHFVDEHRGMLPFSARSSVSSYGIGGASLSYPANVDELDLGPYRLFHRYTGVVLADKGAFADRFDAGNIGLGVLKNFVLTFDDLNRALYLSPGTNFDDGRRRISSIDLLDTVR